MIHRYMVRMCRSPVMAHQRMGTPTVPRPRTRTSMGEAYSAARPKGAEYWWWILWMFS